MNLMLHGTKVSKKSLDVCGVVNNLTLTQTQCSEVHLTAGSGGEGDITSQCQYDEVGDSELNNSRRCWLIYELRTTDEDRRTADRHRLTLGPTSHSELKS